MSARPLNTQKSAKEFLQKVLGFTEDDQKTSELADKIAKLERDLEKTYPEGTLRSTTHRHDGYATDNERIELRKRIKQELISEVRPEDDTNIRLGVGGALPRSGSVLSDKQLFLILGPPASGKSSIARKIADTHRCIICDPDFVKQKLPEFGNGDSAGAVHEESGLLATDYKGSDLLGTTSLLTDSLAKGYNIVLPKVGNEYHKITEFINKISGDYKYKIHVCLIALKRELATERALARFIETGRYVSLSMCYDVVGNEPQLTFHRLRRRVPVDGVRPKKPVSYAAYSTDVEFGEPPIHICSSKPWPGIKS